MEKICKEIKKNILKIHITYVMLKKSKYFVNYLWQFCVFFLHCLIALYLYMHWKKLSYNDSIIDQQKESNLNHVVSQFMLCL